MERIAGRIGEGEKDSRADKIRGNDSRVDSKGGERIAGRIEEGRKDSRTDKRRGK